MYLYYTVGNENIGYLQYNSSLPLYHFTSGMGRPPFASHINSASVPSSAGSNEEESLIRMPVLSKILTACGLTATNK